MSTDAIVKWILSLLTFHTTASKGSSKSQPSPSPTDDKDVRKDNDRVASSLRMESGYYIWKKGEVFQISTHFSTKELSCQCTHSDCIEQRISESLIDKLEMIRLDIAEPLIITSAYRCTKHQEDIRNSGVSTVVAKKSTHELGDAVDCRPKSGMRPGFEITCSQEFTSIGRATNFLHLDLRSGYRRWNY